MNNPKPKTSSDQTTSNESNSLTPENASFHVVGTGASAGGLCALEAFFTHFPCQSGIAVVLSGMGTDGTLGIKAVKGALGMVMAQQPETAQSTSMPQSAIDTDLVDFIFPSEEMPRVILEYTQTASVDYKNLSDSIQKIFALLRNRTGHDFSHYKTNTLYRRIDRRMGIHQLQDIHQYIRCIQKSTHEVGLLFKELFIGVTHFLEIPNLFRCSKSGF